MVLQGSDRRGWAWSLAGMVAVWAVVVGSLSCEHKRPNPTTKGQGSGEPETPPPSVSLSGSAKQGQQVFDAVGCLGCHAVHGRGGNLGPDLSNEGTRGRSREWLKTQIRDPKANNLQSQMFPFDYLSDQQVSDLVDYLESLTPTSMKPAVPSAPSAPASLSPGAKQGKQLFEKVGCLGCHMVNGKGGNVGPDLSNAANEGHSRQWFEAQIRDPKAHDPQSSMPAFDQLSDEQIGNIVDYLETLSTKSSSAGVSSAPSAPSTLSLSAGAKRGKQLFDKVGCLGCHMVDGKGGRLGPDLSNAANAGHSREWLQTQMRNPKAHDPQSSMPGFGQLSDQQISDIVDYLETLSTTSKPSGESGQQRGKQLFDTLACQECHMVNGEGGKVGPDLSDEGNKGRSREWLKTQIRNPRAHMLQTSMPAWGNLPEQQVDDLVDYLESLKAGPGPGGPGSPGPAGGT